MSTVPPGGDPARVDIEEGDVPGARWRPRVGPETLALLREMSALDDATRDRVRDEAVAVLRGCAPPTGPDVSETGLVVGHVQSGKTMSFTTVAALARDNGYPMVIVITGTSKPLTAQSTSRLDRDLRLQTRDDRKWVHLHNPVSRPAHDVQAINGSLADWRDASLPEAARQTVLITVIKNYQRLTQLNGVLQRLDLRRMPVLVIDDEADQAGLNNLVNKGRQSTTYQCLMALRANLPHHTYLQYTATPQAPLLINIIDALAPRFAEVLTPGPDYVGGEEFFVRHANLVRTIPANEIIARNNALTAPPDSLLEAMRLFFLGVASGWLVDGGTGNRSMMVHPSQHRTLHGDYYRWVNATNTSWLQILERPADPDYRELREDFEASYADLQATVPDIKPFDELMGVLARSIRRTRVWEVNTGSGPTPQIEWRADYSHILVGGQAMDRGFTVSGLTVTYMPRGMGTGMADTIQQRARFFGYKRKYLGYCRIYLEGAARTSYLRYVEHEGDLRRRLIEHRRTGRPLDDWKRAFFLSQTLQPTRRSVMDLAPLQAVLSDQWYTPRAPHDSAAAVVSNRAAVDAFLAGLHLRPDPGSPRRSAIETHEMAEDVRLSKVFGELLVPFRITRAGDSQRFTGLLLQLGSYLEAHPDAVCSVYHMSRGATRARTVDDQQDEIKNLYQGAAPVNPPALRGTVYPGDREIRSATGLTVQIHRVRVGRAGGDVDVSTIAVWVPAAMARDWAVQ